MASLLGTSFPYTPPPGQESCACLCVVKDEAPYIHEYIHHHLYFGFTPIVVLVNRTSDTTAAIVGKIAAQHPEVVCLNCDVFDYLGIPAPRIQLLGYAYGIAYLRSHGLARYALLNDADEFWFPVDFSRNVSAWLGDFPQRPFDQITFTWLNQCSREDKFSPPFKNKAVRNARGVKSLIDLTSHIRATHYHYCSLHDSAVHLDARGTPFRAEQGKPYRYGGRVEGHTAYVLHRIQRSEEEYLCTLFRGSQADHQSLKTNRSGYLDITKPVLTISEELISAYQASLDGLIIGCDLEADLAQARATRCLDRERATMGIQSYLENATDKAEALRVLSKIFSGTALEKTVAEAAAQPGREDQA